ncbi:hypothetical protein Tco_1274535 [Tanacetum coccineum]
MSKKTENALQVSSAERVRGVIAKLCSVMWDEDTVQVMASYFNKIPLGWRLSVSNCILNATQDIIREQADQASVFMAMTSVHISSGLVLHQMTSDHNRSKLRI